MIGNICIERERGICPHFVVPFTTDKDYTTAKVIALDSLSGMKPSCDYGIIK